VSESARGVAVPLRWPELVGVVAASMALVALIWLDAALRGAVGIPRDDDWSYLRTIFDFAQTGSFALNGWVHMMFIGQAVPGALLVNLVGPSVAALQVANTVVAVAALVLIYAISRQLLPTAPAVFVTAVLGVNPVFAHLVVTAMTDLPVLALQAGCLLCGVAALRRDRPSWPLTAGVLMCGLAAFTIREYGVVVLLAVALVLIARFFRVPSARRYLVIFLLLLVVCAVLAWLLWSWRRGLPNDIVSTPMPLNEVLVLLCRAAAVLGLMVAPMWVAVSWSNLHTVLRQVPVLLPILGAAVGALIVVVVLTSGNQALGNILHPFGSTWTSVGDGIRAVPLWMFRGLQVLGYGSLIALTMTAATFTWLLLQQARNNQLSVKWQARTWQLMLIVVVTLALLGSYVVATGLLGAPLIDRYFLLVAPLVGVLLLAGIGSWQESRFRRLQGLTSVGTVLVAALIGFVFVDASAQVDGARWRVAEGLVAQGVNPSVIDAGDPWFRYHQQGAGRVVDDGSGRPWWVMFFPNARACWTVVLTQGSETVWGPERMTESLTTVVGEHGRVVVVPGPDACAD